MATRHIFTPLLLAAGLLASAASAQTPVRPSQYVLPPSQQSQGLDGVAMDGSGNLTFVWTTTDFPSTGGYTIRAFTRRFSAADAPLGPPVALEPTRFQSFGGTVVANQRGDVVMTWSRTRGTTAEYFLRRTSPVLGTLNLKLKGGADVAVDRNGNFIVIWVAATPAGYGIFGQRYNANGTTRGPEFQAATNLTHSQSSPSVAMNPATGEFVVAWEDRDTDGSGLGVYGQRFGFTTGRQGSEFPIYVPAVAQRPDASHFFTPQVGRSNNGHFLVMWRIPNADGFSTDILGQRYDSTGARLGARLTLVEKEDIPDGHPQLAMSPKGDFVIAWDDQGTSPAWFRIFHANGTPAGPVQVEDSTGGADYNGAGRVTYGWDGTFVYGWTNYDDNGDFGNSIAFHRYED